MSDETTTPPDKDPGEFDRTLDSEIVSVETFPQVGHYRILSRIGEGGMGTVYEAEQENPRRRVALKVVKAGLSSPGGLRRFELESQVLGRLHHPGIAQIYEAGTADTGSGPQPYFAMEYIRGKTLLEPIQARDISVREKLELMARICDAVHHAHQRGIIHRDLKPGNIMVTPSGDPKILDFGVARATDSDIQATMQTNLGDVIGTVPYMSPEQIKADPYELDTRSDVYALGVILYEILTGQLPHDLRQKSLAEAARMITEEDPATVSSLNRVCRGDVETIVGKALEKDKNRRYGSAAELAADIRRYLKDEPIVARPPSTSYQLKKFAKRNKVLVGGVAAVFVVLVAGIAVSATQAEIARREALKASTVNTFLNNMLASASPMMLSAEDSLKGREVTVVEVLGEAGQRVEKGDLIGQPLVDAEISGTLGNTFRHLGDYRSAKPFLTRALDLRREHLGDSHVKTAESMNSLAALYHQANLDGAEPLFREALEIQRKRRGERHPDVATVLNNLGELLDTAGKNEEAGELYRQALAIRQEQLGDEHEDTAETMHNLASLLQTQGHLDEAEALFQKALETRRKVLGEEHPQVGRTLHALAFVLEDQGRFAEAEQTRREVLDIWRNVLGPDHPFLSASLVNLGVVLKDQGKLAEAEPLYLEALAIQRKTLAAEDPNIGGSLYNLAKLFQAQGKLSEAEQYCREALDILTRALPEGHPTLAGVMSGLGSVLTDRGRPVEGEPLLKQAMSIYEETFPGKWYSQQVRSLLGAAVLGQGRYAEAETLLLESQKVLQSDPGVTADRKRQAVDRIIQLYESWDQARPGTGKAAKAKVWRETASSLDS